MGALWWSVPHEGFQNVHYCEEFIPALLLSHSLVEKPPSLFPLKRPTLGSPRNPIPLLLKYYCLRLAMFLLAPSLSIFPWVPCPSLTCDTVSAWTQTEQVSVGSEMASPRLGSIQFG